MEEIKSRVELIYDYFFMAFNIFKTEFATEMYKRSIFAVMLEAFEFPKRNVHTNSMIFQKSERKA